MPTTLSPAVRTFGLTKQYGDTLALDELDLEIPAGRIVGCLGPNGAGKTTTMRLLMGLIRPSEGRAEIFGRDTWNDREAVHRSVGYLQSEFAAPANETARRFLTHIAALREGVDWDHAEQLAERFDLDLDKHIGSLSHGNRRKVGLIQALMHRPDLLLLDEPTSGLDPLMQREFAALLRELRADGRTVLLSSHVLAEVETVADDVAMLGEGRLIVMDSVSTLKERARQHLHLRFTSSPPIEELRSATGVESAEADGYDVDVLVTGSTADLLRVAAPHGVDRVVSAEADLNDIFAAYFEEKPC